MAVLNAAALHFVECGVGMVDGRVKFGKYRSSNV
jgi:hypothetical protein